MTTIDRTKDEKNINRIVLLSSTFIILIVSITIAYLLINLEVENFKKHLQLFKTTLIEREKFSIKTTIKNLVNDIEYEKITTQDAIKNRVQTQAISMYNLAQSLYWQNVTLPHDKILVLIKELIKSTTTKQDDIHYFIFKTDGTLLFNTKKDEEKLKNFMDFEDLNGKKFVQEILKKDGFSSYLWFKKGSSKVVQKVTFSKKLKKLNIVIGAGAFMNPQHNISQNMLDKMQKYNFRKDEFLFVYNIKSLNNPLKNSKLVLEKNIQTKKEELYEVKRILIKSDYKANIFHTYNNQLLYATYLPNLRTFIATGIYLDTINKIVKKETIVSHNNLTKKIIFLSISIIIITLIFFVFSYVISKKIENMFKNYRLKVARSQQLLIQKSKMASMGEMIGNIAHQWRQPLSQLSGLFFDIESAYDFKELDKKYLTNCIDEANDLVEYMSKTIDDFREFFNPNTKKEIFNLNATLNHVLNIIHSTLKYNQIKITLDIDDSLHVEGQSNEFSQVVLNLISNSKEIAAQREIANPEIQIFTEIDKNIIYLHVEDNCGGIDEQIINKIFEPYFTTKFNYGTGIGLYMSKIIIENKMHGHIYANNISADKTRFTISLQSKKATSNS